MVLTWTPDYTGDPQSPPPTAILEVTGDAWAGGDVSWNCDDGLGDAVVDGDSGGTHYFVLNSPGSVITKTYSPSASGYGLNYNEAGVEISAAAYAVTLDFTGVVDPVKNKSILVGQQFDATVNFGGLSPDPNATYAWLAGTPGSPFTSWIVNGNTAVYTGPNYGTGQTMTCYFAADYNGVKVPINCTVNAPDWGLTNIPVSDSVLVQGPAPSTANYAIDSFLMGYFDSQHNFFQDNTYHQDNQSPQTNMRLRDPVTSGSGFNFTAHVTDPGSPWTDGTSKIGRWYLMQLLTPNSYAFDSNHKPISPDPYNGQTVLDHVQEYMGSDWPCFNPSDEPMRDSPGLGNLNGHPNGGHYGATFLTYLMYTPPPSATGRGVMTVPIRVVSWNCTAECSSDGTTWSIANADEEPKTISYADFPNWFPRWSAIHP